MLITVRNHREFANYSHSYFIFISHSRCHLCIDNINLILIIEYLFLGILLIVRRYMNSMVKVTKGVPCDTIFSGFRANRKWIFWSKKVQIVFISSLPTWFNQNVCFYSLRDRKTSCRSLHFLWSWWPRVDWAVLSDLCNFFLLFEGQVVVKMKEIGGILMNP